MATTVPDPSVPLTGKAISEPAQRGSEVRPRRWGRRLLIGLALTATALWFSPEIVSRTALRQEVPKLLFPFFQGRVALGETSLGWNSPVVVRNVEIADIDGTPLMTIGELRSEATLWQLVSNRQALGRFTLDRCMAFVQATANGSNFDQTIADFWNAPASDPQQSLELVCLGTRIELRGMAEGERLPLPPFDARVRVAMDGPRSFQLDLKAQDTEHPGSVLQVQVSSQDTAIPDGLRVKVAATDWQLASFNPVVQARWGQGRLFGALNGHSELELVSATPMRWSSRSDLTIAQLELFDLPGLDAENLRMNKVVFTGDLRGTDQWIECLAVALDSDLAAVEVSGNWALAHWQHWTSSPDSQPSVALIDEDFQVRGWIDAAAIARQWPRLLHLRDNVRVTEGRLTFAADSRLMSDVRTWTAQLEVDQLAAAIENRPWRWDTPFKGAARFSRQGEELVCDRLRVDSSFLQAEGSGTVRQAKLTARADLDRLTEELSEIVDWGPARMSGTLAMTADVNVPESGKITLQSQARIERLVLGSAAEPWWSEPKLSIDVTATGGNATTAEWLAWESGQLELAAGEDRLSVQLREPADWSRSDRELPLRAELRGDLQRWGQRLSFWLPAEFRSLQGQGLLVANARWSLDRIVLEETQIQAKSLRWTTADWRIEEPELQVQTRGTWDAVARQFDTPETLATGAFGRVEWTNGRWSAQADSTLPVRGDWQFELDLGRLSQWRIGPVTSHILGRARGSLRSQPQAEALELAADTQVQNLMYVTLEPVSGGAATGANAAWVTQWKEPALRLQTQGRWMPTQQQFVLQNFAVTGDGLSLRGTGNGTWSAAELQFETNGQLAYDWAKLSTRLSPELAQKFQATGVGAKPYELRGRWPLGSTTVQTELVGTAGIGWESLRLMGLPLGAAEIRGNFVGNSGSIQPLALAVAEGQVRLAPQFRFHPGPVAIMHPPGRLVDRVRLSPELCRDLLQYMAPLMADATEIDGRFSLDLQQGTWPLGQTTDGVANGRLEIHGASLRPGTGLGRLMSVVDQVRAIVGGRDPRTPAAERLLVELPEQTVQFRQTDRRMTHDRLILRTRDVEIQTRGSVGFDESLNLVAAVPIRPEWISDERLRSVLGGQTLQVPITGTLRQPQVDPSVLSDLARRAATGRIEQTIDNKLREQLNKLLPR